MISNRPDINAVLDQMRDLQQQVQSASSRMSANAVAETSGTDKPEFGVMMKNAVDTVNEVQKQSGALAEAYEQGDPNVSLSQVMVASQKAGVSFQATMEVRNKLIEAYKEVMSMPI